MPAPGGDSPPRGLVATTGAPRLEEDVSDALAALKAEDEADRALAAHLAQPPSDSDIRVLVSSAAAAAAGAGGGAPSAAAAPAAAGAPAKLAAAGAAAAAATGTAAAPAAATAPAAAAAPAASAAAKPAAAPAAAAPPLTPEAEAAVAQFDQLYHDAYLGRAVQHLDEFLAAHPSARAADLAAALAARGIDLGLLRARAALVAEGIRECRDDEGWRLVRDDPGGLRLLYRQGPQSATAHCFKAACEIDCEMQELLSMAREFDLVPSWNSYITQTNILQISSLVELLVYASVWLPWPFAERDVLIQAVGIDMLAEEGCLAISFSSPDGGMPDGTELPAGYDGRTHVRVLPGSCLMLSPLPPRAAGGKPRVRVNVVTMLDSGQWVPEAVITFVLSVFAPFFFSAVLKLIASSFGDPSTPLEQRIKAHPELYAAMAERVAHFLAGHPDAP